MTLCRFEKRRQLSKLWEPAVSGGGRLDRSLGDRARFRLQSTRRRWWTDDDHRTNSKREASTLFNAHKWTGSPSHHGQTNINEQTYLIWTRMLVRMIRRHGHKQTEIYTHFVHMDTLDFSMTACGIRYIFDRFLSTPKHQCHCQMEKKKLA